MLEAVKDCASLSCSSRFVKGMICRWKENEAEFTSQPQRQAIRPALSLTRCHGVISSKCEWGGLVSSDGILICVFTYLMEFL